jgi:hypothetical protein
VEALHVISPDVECSATAKEDILVDADAGEILAC